MKFGIYATGLILLMFILAARAAAVQEACDCRHFKKLKSELRDAVKLQKAFSEQIAELQKEKGLLASKAALEAFAKGKALGVPDGKGASAFDYTPRGDHVGVDSISKFSQHELCRLSDSAAVELNQTVEATACKGIGESIRAHEAVHYRQCLANGFMAYLNMHGADRAREEAEAYGVQIDALRREITRVLGEADARIEADMNSHLEMPPNKLYTVLDMHAKAKVLIQPMTSSQPSLTLKGEGKQTVDAKLKGNCKFTKGVPYTVQAFITLETDGEVAKIRMFSEKKDPGSVLTCVIDGFSRMKYPLPLYPPLVPEMIMPLEPGAEGVSNLADVPNMSQSGTSVTSEMRMRLLFCEGKN